MTAWDTRDVTGLPTYTFGHHSLMWWGTMGIVVIEGTVFIMAIGTYLYLRSLSPQWPVGALPPELTFGTLNTVILLLSAIPNQWTKKVAEQEKLREVRIGLVICLLFAFAFLAVRALEFGALNTHWDTNAYGSIVYALMVLHTIHLVTDVIDTIVLTVLIFTGPLEGKRFVDVSENAVYWWFVVGSWVFIYATIYWVPRLP
jgi:heme/copper-type cytochrome/quinol oxidase subunit 3